MNIFHIFDLGLFLQSGAHTSYLHAQVYTSHSRRARLCRHRQHHRCRATAAQSLYPTRYEPRLNAYASRFGHDDGQRTASSALLHLLRYLDRRTDQLRLGDLEIGGSTASTSQKSERTSTVTLGLPTSASTESAHCAGRKDASSLNRNQASLGYDIPRASVLPCSRGDWTLQRQ